MKDITNQLIEETTSGILPLNRSVNGICKLTENQNKTSSKRKAISQLASFNYLTPPKLIAKYLTILFGIWEEKPHHWMYIAQFYNPKSINSVIRQMVKMHQRGSVPLNSTGAYFSSVLKRFHKPRKGFRKKDEKGTNENE